VLDAALLRAAAWSSANGAHLLPVSELALLCNLVEQSGESFHATLLSFVS